ncbi:MAG: hypothetical protein NZ958_05820 [Bacteroidia bacterium]|nr:hypothetical protein [Bacteroidia bacterium]MDW8088861.1 hypothetical protein [Bacteroidia bacterium]
MKGRMGIIGLWLLWGCQPPSPPPAERAADTLVVTPKTSLPLARPQPDSFWTDLARLLGGLPPQDSAKWAVVLRDTSWQLYARRLQYLWEQRQKSLYDSLAVWAARELEPYHTWKGRIFYPFSGADWPTVYTVYPQGSTYILFGLEQEGDPHYLRTLPPREIPPHLQGPYGALADLLRLTFFKTKDMQTQLAHGKLRGLLPVFLALFARTGHAIYKVEHIILREGGQIDTLAASQKKPPQSCWDNPITGLRFQVGRSPEALQEVIYFSLNAANAGLKTQTGSYAFLSRLAPCVTLIKSASYLLFSPEFSEMRRLILTQSVGILQEDTGIPYRFFDTTAWRIALYGSYTQPIPLFRSKYQQDLWEAYRRLPVKPLPFGIGYHIYPAQSNLLWAVRRDPMAALPPLPEDVPPPHRRMPTQLSPSLLPTDTTPRLPTPPPAADSLGGDSTAAPSSGSE